MPDLCVVKDCRSNFAEDLHIEAPVVSVYKFPKDNDLIIKWKKALSLEENWQPSENSSVCEKHFLKSGLTKYESGEF